LSEIHLDRLQTETRNERTKELDQMTIHEMLRLMNQEDQSVPRAIEKELPIIEKAIKAIIHSFEQGGRLIYMGAGTSGRLGVLDAAECVPTFSVDPGMVIGLIAGGEKAMLHAVEGAEDSEELAINDLKELDLTEKDAVVGIAASGRTPYAIGGLKYAREKGAYTISLSCNKESKVSHYAGAAIEVETGPEVLTGSTRLKAGTAQKLVLNMLSTLSMVGIGKVYQNLMIDVQPSNLKLEERAKRIIMEATDATYEEAEKVFESSKHRVKTAIVMQLTGTSKEEAEDKIKAANGFIRPAISEE